MSDLCAQERNDLSTSGEATLDVDRAVSQMGRWWQSWWDDERHARWGRNAGASQGASEFMRQYDDDNDQRLTIRELPPHMRGAFRAIDRNEDHSISRDELKRYGEMYFDRSSRPAQSSAAQASDRYADRDDSDRSWSEWWSSWWSGDQSRGSQQASADQGSRQLLSVYDDNADGFLSRSELPGRMREDFDYVDRNSDGFVSRNEFGSTDTLSARVSLFRPRRGPPPTKRATFPIDTAPACPMARI